eukprot:6635226-Ditylum_brightwellii.AAC.1
MELSTRINDLCTSQLDKKFKDVTSLLAKTKKAMDNKTYKVSSHSNDYSKDTEKIIKKFPFLTPVKFKPHHQVFLKNLAYIKLESNAIEHMELFWNKIKSALESTFACTSLFSTYNKLQYINEHTRDDIFKHLVPPKDHHLHDTLKTTYNQLADVLFTQLIDPNTISSEKAPNIALSLTLKKHQPDGFIILTNIIWDNSPHLGVQGESAENKVMNFTINQGESTTKFYIRTISIQSQLILFQDKTGQKNKLLGKFLISLNLQKTYQSR